MITSGRFERSYPLIVGLLSGAAFAFLIYKLQISLSDSVKDLFSSAMNVSAIAPGFMGTIQSILLTGEKKRLIEYLKEAKKFNKLVDYLLVAIALCIASCGVFRMCSLFGATQRVCS